MTTTLVLGMPRSGTSLTTQMLDRMGLKTDIPPHNTIDGYYKASHRFLQHLDIHQYLMNLPNIQSFALLPKPPKDLYVLKYLLRQKKIVKEPYLLSVLPFIQDEIKNIVLVIRNPNEVLESFRDFIKDNPQSTAKISLKDWHGYYETFVRVMSLSSIPFTVVVYKDLLTNPKYVAETLSQFLHLDQAIDYDFIQAQRRSVPLLNIPVQTMYLFTSLINQVSTKDILLRLEILIKDNTGVNCACFCGSTKKYKKCCGKPNQPE